MTAIPDVTTHTFADDVAVNSSTPVAGDAVRGMSISALIALHVALSAITYQRSIQPPEMTPHGLQRTNVPRYWINGFF